jgi:hypothetical protein
MTVVRGTEHLLITVIPEDDVWNDDYSFPGYVELNEFVVFSFWNRLWINYCDVTIVCLAFIYMYFELLWLVEDLLPYFPALFSPHENVA